MSQNECSKLNQKIQKLLELSSRRLAREKGFVQRHSKLSGDLFLKILLFTWLKNPRASLELLAQSARRFGLQISAQGLAKRFNDAAVRYVEALFQEVLQDFFNTKRLDVPFLQQFNGIYLIDSTHVEVPRPLKSRWQGFGGMGSGAGIKLLFTWEFLGNNLQGLLLSDSKRSDRLHCPDFLPVGSLHLFDLGFFNLKTFETIRQAGAFYISRLKSCTQVSAEVCDEPRGLETICPKIQGDFYEDWLWLGGAHQTYARVVFVRCPAEQVAERRRKAYLSARQRHWNPSERHLSLLDWNIFITNLSSTAISIPHILRLYRLRWQIELLFKLCKSQLGLEHVQGCGEARILVQLYCRLILLLLFAHMSSPYRLYQNQELSLPKAFSLFSSYADLFMNSCKQRWQSFDELLSELTEEFLYLAQKSKRKKSPSALAYFLSQIP